MQAQKPTTIGVDFSSTTVYLACANNQKVLATASINIESLAWAFPMLKNILHTYHEDNKTNKVVYVEQPWVNAARNPKTAMQMMRTATIIELAIVESYLLSEFVHPMTWRKELYGSAKTLNSKEYAVDWVKINLGYEPPPIGKTKRSRPDHNFAEAVCIAIYGSMKIKEEQMTNGEEA